MGLFKLLLVSLRILLHLVTFTHTHLFSPFFPVSLPFFFPFSLHSSLSLFPFIFSPLHTAKEMVMLREKQRPVTPVVFFLPSPFPPFSLFLVPVSPSLCLPLLIIYVASLASSLPEKYWLISSYFSVLLWEWNGWENTVETVNHFIHIGKICI